MQGQNIQVFVRCRPLAQQERRSVVDVVTERREVKVLDRSKSTQDTKNFYFDRVFASDARQGEVYKSVVRPLIDQVLLGFNCTVFAYGQTGTGKTYTMEGMRSEVEMSWEDDPHSGIIPRAISQLFDTLKDHDNEFTVRVSFLELYNEDTYDLLSPIDDTTKLKIFDDAQKKGSVILHGLEEIIVRTKAEIYDILKRGSAKRQTAATLLNACSSRSHTIFSVTVHIREGSMEEEELLKIGKLNLVDLAGSENIRRSGAQDKRAREAGNINQSLLTLGRVITALVEKRPHIPYRESKLTRLLQDSLGGKTKTSIIATISPAAADLEDTLSTLDYASRAKKITNQPEMNQKLRQRALYEKYDQEIKRLRRDLEAARGKNGIYIDEENYNELLAEIREKEDRIQALEAERKKADDLFEDFARIKKELQVAKDSCIRQQKLIEVQKDKEKRLASQAKELIRVAETASNDNNLLHSKKERIENILKENRASVDRYHPEIREDIARFESLIELCNKELSNLTEQFLDKARQERASVIEQVGIAENGLAERLKSQSNLESVAQLIAQRKDHEEEIKRHELKAEELKSQFFHHESKAKDLREQVSALSTEIEKSLQTALKSHVDEILNEKPVSKMLGSTMSNFSSEDEQISSKFQQVSVTWASSIKREINSLRQKMDRFFTRELREDIQTGLTPQRRVFDIPKRLERSSVCGDIEEDAEDFNHMNTSGIENEV